MLIIWINLLVKKFLERLVFFNIFRFFCVKKKSVEFEVCCRFFVECDKNGSSTWSIPQNKIQIAYYYNGCNQDKIFYFLNRICAVHKLADRAWKMSFTMCLTRPPPWIKDFSGMVIF